MKKSIQSDTIIISIFLLITFFFAFKFTEPFKSSLTSKHEIISVYTFGKEIVEGGNPYQSKTINPPGKNEIAQLLPMPYYIAGYSAKFWFDSRSEWLNFWHVIVFISFCVIGIYIFRSVRKVNYIFAYILLFLWLFNRWSLSVMISSGLDFLVLFFLLSSIMILSKYRIIALLLVGMAISLNQNLIYILPLLLVIDLRNKANPGWLRLMGSLLWMLIIPLIFSTPFLLADAKSHLSAVFLAKANFINEYTLPSFDAYKHTWNWVAKLPLLIMLFGVLVIYAFSYIEKYLAVFLSLVVYISFSLNFSSSYIVWIISFIPFVLSEFMIKDDRIKNMNYKYS